MTASPPAVEVENQHQHHENHDDDEEEDVLVLSPPSRDTASGDTPVRSSSATSARRDNNASSFEEPFLLASSRRHHRLARPRSNPRDRTSPAAIRYESPLTSFNAFRLVQDDDEQDNHVDEPQAAASTTPRSQQQRLITTVRPMATTRATTHFASTTTTRSTITRRSSSNKQGRPSQRKQRRWNNDSFQGIASELAKGHPTRGPAVAELFLQAQAEAPILYKSYYCPSHDQESAFDKLDHPENKELRDAFVRGEESTLLLPRRHSVVAKQKQIMTPAMMRNRVQDRLWNILIRLNQTSPSSTQFIVNHLEQFLVKIFSCSEDNNEEKHQPLQEEQEQKDDDNCWWTNILSQPPTVLVRPNKNSNDSQKRIVIRFVGMEQGLHRLFLHAVCQFHGWQCCTSGKTNKSCLFVSGESMMKDACSGAPPKQPHAALLQHLVVKDR